MIGLMAETIIRSIHTYLVDVGAATPTQPTFDGEWKNHIFGQALAHIVSQLDRAVSPLLLVEELPEITRARLWEICRSLMEWQLFVFKAVVFHETIDHMSKTYRYENGKWPKIVSLDVNLRWDFVISAECFKEIFGAVRLLEVFT